MAFPKSFADDGAFGATSSPTGAPAAAPAPDASTMFNPGEFTSAPNDSFSGPMGPTPSTATPPTSGGFGGGGLSDSSSAPSLSPMSGGYGGGGLSSGGGSSLSPSPVGLSFSQGGAIDDGSGGDDNGSPQQDAIQRALSTVDGVLAFGRKLHGLGGGDDEGAIKTASNYPPGRMPAKPGNQSESGVPPIQPMPGPLPPTSNPFGKRADAGDQGNDQGQDDQSGAIDTEEDAA